MFVTKELKLAIWNKGRKVEGFDPGMYRKDACGAWIIWDKYGVQDNIYGWEIDHICPTSLLEGKFSEEEIWNIKNLRPLQHENNASKLTDYPSYTAVVTAEGKKNVNKKQNLVVNEKIRKILHDLYNV